MKNNNVITLSKFLSRYANLTGEDLVNMTHEEVRVLLPHFKRTTFEYIEKNEDELANGNILLVSDGKKVIPYFAPELTQDETKTQVIRKMEKRTNEDNIIDYTSLSVFELKKLLRKKFNSGKNKSGAKKELEKRGVILRKKYNRNKVKNEGEI